MSPIQLDERTPAPQPPKSVDVTAENFAAEVIQASSSQLVIVAFWSAQSAASGQLLPHLEKVTAGSHGAAKLTKIDVAKNQQIVQQMHVQSIPAVYAFWQGQPVDGFMGAIPETQLKTWLEKLIQTTGATGSEDPRKGIENAIQQAEAFLEQGDIATAQSIYEDLSSEFPEEPAVVAGCIKCLVKLDKTNDAANLIKHLPDIILLDAKVHSAKAMLDLAIQTASTDSGADLLGEVSANPDNHEARFEYAMQLYGTGDSEGALSQLLEIVARDRAWQDEKARLQILKIFEALGPMHEHTVEARRKLATILFS